MSNYSLKHIAPLPVFLHLFAAGVFLGGLGGLLLGFFDCSSFGVAGGLFLGLVLGIISGVCGATAVFAFNTLAPLTGGIPVVLVPVETKPDPLPDIPVHAPEKSVPASEAQELPGDADGPAPDSATPSA